MEITVNQKYIIDKKEYSIADIRVTNILSPDDFKVAVLFEPLDKENVAFQARAEEVLKDPAYQLVTSQSAR